MLLLTDRNAEGMEETRRLAPNGCDGAEAGRRNASSFLPARACGAMAGADYRELQMDGGRAFVPFAARDFGEVFALRISFP